MSRAVRICSFDGSMTAFFTVRASILAVMLFALGCAADAPAPTPTLGPAPTPEVAPPPPEFVPTLTPRQAHARDETRNRWDEIRPLEKRMSIAADQCRGDKAHLYEDEFDRLIAEARDEFDGDWVAHERRVSELEGKLQPIVERAEPLCEEEAARRRRSRGAPSTFAAHALYGLVIGGLCGRYMVGLTIRRGLLFGLVVSLATTALAAFVPFPGREFVPSAAWLGLAVVLTAALCWHSNRFGW